MEPKPIHPVLRSHAADFSHFTKGYNKDLSVMLFINPPGTFFQLLLKKNCS